KQGDGGAHAGRGQGGEDRERVDVALVEHAENDIDGGERKQDQYGKGGERGLEGLRASLEAAVDAGGHANIEACALNGGSGLAEGDAGREIEGQGGGRGQALVIDRERDASGFEVGDGG